MRAEENLVHSGRLKMAILCVGSADKNVLGNIRGNLSMVFPETTCVVLKDAMPMPREAYNAVRRQYHSSMVLTKIRSHVRGAMVDCVLGVTDSDLYAPRLNFVFGEAQCPGRAAVISLRRLKPEFYGRPPNRGLFMERSVKEAVHEIGHTIGLRHCHNPRCIMSFSNNIMAPATAGFAPAKSPSFSVLILQKGVCYWTSEGIT